MPATGRRWAADTHAWCMPVMPLHASVARRVRTGRTGSARSMRTSDTNSACAGATSARPSGFTSAVRISTCSSSMSSHPLVACCSRCTDMPGPSAPSGGGRAGAEETARSCDAAPSEAAIGAGSWPLLRPPKLAVGRGTCEALTDPVASPIPSKGRAAHTAQLSSDGGDARCEPQKCRGNGLGERGDGCPTGRQPCYPARSRRKQPVLARVQRQRAATAALGWLSGGSCLRAAGDEGPSAKLSHSSKRDLNPRCAPVTPVTGSDDTSNSNF